MNEESNDWDKLKDLLSSGQSLPPWTLGVLQRIQAGISIPTDYLLSEPSLVMTKAGLTPDPWQTKLLQSESRRLMLLCSRQSGKSQIAAALALKVMLLESPALVLAFSGGQAQSNELYYAKFLRLYEPWRRIVPPTAETGQSLTLANGSRWISMPVNTDTLVGYSAVDLLILDEAAIQPDSLYHSATPMVIVAKGRILACSTPMGTRGWFYREWISQRPWERYKVTALDCARIPLDELQWEQESMGERMFRQNYMCSFEDAVDAVFRESDIQKAMARDVRPLF